MACIVVQQSTNLCPKLELTPVRVKDRTSLPEAVTSPAAKTLLAMLEAAIDLRPSESRFTTVPTWLAPEYGSVVKSSIFREEVVSAIIMNPEVSFDFTMSVINPPYSGD